MDQLPIIVALVVGAFFVFSYLKRHRSPAALERAAKAISSGGTMIDVRTPEEFRTGHWQGAVNIPVADLADDFDQLPGRERPVIVYCRTGSRSSVAARILKNAGFSQVMDLGPIGNTEKLPVVEVKNERRIPSGKSMKKRRHARARA